MTPLAVDRLQAISASPRSAIRASSWKGNRIQDSSLLSASEKGYNLRSVVKAIVSFEASEELILVTTSS